jgi:hypothetical protein
MPANRIEIGHLRLRLPGLSAAESRAIAEDALRHAAAELGAPARTVAIGDLSLRIRIPEGTPVNRVAAAIGREIARSIREAAR